MSASVDDASLLSLRRLRSRLARYAAGATVAWLLLTGHSWAELAGLMQLACLLGGSLAIGIACRGRERVNAPSLNHWDEAMVLNCLSFGIHLLHRSLV